MYASLDDFDAVIRHLMHAPGTEPLPLTLAEEITTLSLLLRVFILPDLPDDAAYMVRELCNRYADEVIRRYPYAEGYIDYLYGAAALGRAHG